MKKKNETKWNWILGIILFISIISSAIFLTKEIVFPLIISWLITLEATFFLFIINDKPSGWTFSEIISGKFVSLMVSGFAILIVTIISLGIKLAFTEMIKLTKQQWINGCTYTLITIGVCGIIVGYFYFNYKMANKLGKKGK